MIGRRTLVALALAAAATSVLAAWTVLRPASESSFVWNGQERTESAFRQEVRQELAKEPAAAAVLCSRLVGRPTVVAGQELASMLVGASETPATLERAATIFQQECPSLVAGAADYPTRRTNAWH